MCGVVGAISNSKENLSIEVYRGLLALQHRGQDGAGILSYDDEVGRFYQHKGRGLVADVFKENQFSQLSGKIAIGHTRYTTVGSNSLSDLQPVVQGHPYGLGIAHNGNTLNYLSLVDYLRMESGTGFTSCNDIELILYLLGSVMIKSKKHKPVERLAEAVSSLGEKLNGGYGVVGILGSYGLFAFRDPHGIRPLCLGKRVEASGVSYCISSESVALNYLGFEFVKDIAPGELLFISKDCEVTSFNFSKKSVISRCMFEWVYFASAESSVDSIPVYKARLVMGVILGRRIRKMLERLEIAPDIVVPVPDTSRTSAISLAETIGIPYRECLIKNRYVHRSFILSDQEKRESAVELKLGPVKSEIIGKNILLVDDSVVRGTTSKRIVSMLKKYGAKKVTLVSTSPPITHPCFYGVDFPSEKELIASNKSIDDIAIEIGVDRLIYLEIEELYQAIGNDLCVGCLNGSYPTSTFEGKTFANHRIKESKQVAGALI